MAAPIRFYFDFTSTYSYIAAHQIDELAARYGREVDWCAVSLGHIFQAIGQTPPPFIPERLKYNLLDLERSCTLAGLPWKVPPVFPFDAKIPRYIFWTLKAKDDALARSFARMLLRRAFGEGLSIVTVAEIADFCGDMPGLDEAALTEAAANTAAKRAVVTAMDSARADGMIGAPFMVLDGEPFWGADRLSQIEQRLAHMR